ncbi:MAG: hypothetical protein RJA36_1330 [Pseudomonadota bacterium]|jgi:hypothetical protein
MKTPTTAWVAFALAAPLCATAQTAAAPDSAARIQELRQEIDALRAAYEARLLALEARLLAAEQQTAAAAPQAPGLPATPASEAASLASMAATPAANSGANAFNPALSLILSGLYAASSRDPASYHLPGFQLPAGAGIGPGSRGLSLAESELGLSASIDPWWRGAAHIALHPDNSVSVEEAFVQTSSLGEGLTLKGGRFYSGVGYLNSQHAHRWDFVDNPLAYQAFLGTQYGDDGVQLRWLAPTEQFLQLGAELGRGRSFPGSDRSRNGAGMSALTAHTGGDLGDSHNWRAGLSVLNASATEQELSLSNPLATLADARFTGSTRVWVLDGVWKWAPNGNAARTHFKLQGEYLRSTRSGELSYDPGGTNSTDRMRGAQSGWYLQGVYQFMPRWRLGLRTEALNAGAPDYGINAPLLAGAGHQPSKRSLMLDYSPSEFSRLRLQLAQDRARAGAADRQLFLQYQMSLGAHGAHGY